MFYCIKSFYAPLKRFLDVFYWFTMFVFAYMHIYTCARKQKKRQKKSLQRALPISFLFQKKDKKNRSKELFSLWMRFSFLAKDKKRGSLSLPLSYRLFFVLSS